MPHAICVLRGDGFAKIEGQEPGPDRDMELRDAIQRLLWNGLAMVVLG